MGTIVNTLAVLAGGAVGLLLKKGMPERFQNLLFNALGTATILIGISGALAGIFRVNADGTLAREDLLMLIFSLVIGGILGEAIGLERRFNRLAEKVKEKFSQNGDNRFVEGLMSSFVLFCVGAMTVVGAMEDGLLGNPATLYAKSVMDGTMSIVFASVYGVSVLFSAALVFIYQGLLTLLAFAIRSVATDLVMMQMSMAGSAVIMMIGMNMMGIKKINVANFLPATFIPLIWAGLSGMLPFS